MIYTRKALLLASLSAVVAIAYTGIAIATKYVVVPIPTLEVTMDGSSGVTPKALSKTAYTPVAFALAGSIRSFNPSEPQTPPLQEVLIDARNFAVDTKGYPTCAGGSREVRIKAVRKACRDSIVGSGAIGVSVKFPDLAPVPATSPLLIFNGGTSGGVTTFYIHGYLTQPITTAVVATMKIEKSGAHFKSVVSIPKIANGAGSVTDFRLKIDKKFAYKGKAQRSQREMRWRQDPDRRHHQVLRRPPAAFRPPADLHREGLRRASYGWPVCSKVRW